MVDMFFKNRKLNIHKLTDYGFVKCDKGYSYSANLVDEQMKLNVMVLNDGKISTMVIDNTFGEEYILHLVPDAAGPFVGQVKAEYEAVLEDIASKCFDVEVFKAEQSKAIITYVREKYGDELEFLWEKFPDNAIWRRKDNEKWYGALLTVKASKLGLDGDVMIEILDLRIKPTDIETTVDKKRFFMGYHMNKKHWYTLLLDGSISTEEICRRIDESYLLAKK